MPLPRTLIDFNVFTDGENWAGRAREVTLPNLAQKTEEYSAGGMAGTVDIPIGPMEKMEFDITFAEHNPRIYSLAGRDDVPVSLRGALGPGGAAAQPMLVEMRALVRSIEPGSFKRGEASAVKLMGTASYLRLVINGSAILEIDAGAYIHNLDGRDLLAGARAALGL